MNFSSFFFFWLLIEINILIFLVFIARLGASSSEENTFLRPCLYYFICQRVSSLVFIFLSIANHDEVYCFIIATVCICLKIGIFPFYFWRFYLRDFLDEITFYLFLTFQKIPLIMYLLYNQTEFVVMFIIPNLLLGVYLLLISFKINYLILRSSIYRISWIFIIWFSSLFLFMLFFLSYCAHVFYVAKIYIRNLSKRFKINFIVIIFIMFLCGLPPFNFFFFKYYSICLFFMKNSIPIFFLIWLFSFAATLIYFKKFFMLSLGFKKFYNCFPIKFQKLYLIFSFLILFF